MVGAMAAIVTPLYLAALAARPESPVQQELPRMLSEPPTSVGAPGVALAAEPAIELRPTTDGSLEVVASAELEGADLLLYWAPAGGGRSLADAFLLGPLRGGERQLFELPTPAAVDPGVIVLYSLGHDEEVAYAPWPASPGDRP
jgi:hypothetical protein